MKSVKGDVWRSLNPLSRIFKDRNPFGVFELLLPKIKQMNKEEA